MMKHRQIAPPALNEENIQNIAPSSQEDRLRVALYWARETLAPLLISNLFKIEIAQPVIDPRIIYHFDFDQIDVSVDFCGPWHAVHHYTIIAQTDIRNIESRGADFLSLMSAFSGQSLAEVAYEIVKYFTPSLPELINDFSEIHDEWEAARCPRRPDFGDDVGGKLNLKASLRENAPNLPAFEGVGFSEAIEAVMWQMVPAIAAAALPEGFHDIADGVALTEAMSAVYGLGEGIVLLHLFEAITAASLGRIEAEAFVDLFNQRPGNYVSGRVRAMVRRPTLGEIANDD